MSSSSADRYRPSSEETGADSEAQPGCVLELAGRAVTGEVKVGDEPLPESDNGENPVRLPADCGTGSTQTAEPHLAHRYVPVPVFRQH